MIFGQEIRTTRKVIEVQKESTFFLTTISSRTYVSVDIPENSIGWYIAFTSTADESSINPINLFAQIAAHLDESGILSLAVDNLMVPAGTGRCDIYLTNIENRNKFINYSTYNYYDDISRLNLNQGIISVDSTFKGNYQILLYNPSFTTNVKVTIEVTAIVEEQSVDMTIWSNEAKDDLYNRILLTTVLTNGLRVAPGLTDCVVNKIISQKNPEDISKMSETEFSNFKFSKIDECTQELSGGSKSPETEKAITYGTLAWKSYENGNVDKCIELSKKALELDPTLGWVKANLGLCSLIKNDEASATDYYIDAINLLKKDQINGRKMIKECIKDIDDALKRYPDLKGYQDIKDLLESEL